MHMTNKGKLDLAIELGQRALKIAVSALYFKDDSGYESELWKIVKLLGGTDAIELLVIDKNAAYEKYVKSIR